MNKRPRWLSDFLDKIALIVTGIVAWAILASLSGPQVLTGPVPTMRYIGVLFADPDFWQNVWATLEAFTLALVIAWTGGVAIGLILGAHRLTGQVLEPILAGLYSIPKITLYPVILLIFGLTLSARVAFGAIHGIIPVAIFTMTAVNSVRPIHIRAAQSMRLGAMKTVWYVMVPACLPGIMSGLRVGFSLTLLGTLLGEMFASQHGIGFLLSNAMQTDNTKLIVALAVLLVATATVAGNILIMIDNRFHRYIV